MNILKAILGIIGILGLILICGFGGAILGLLVGQGFVDGAYVRWETMVLPEGLHPTQFTTDDGPFVYLQTEEGQLLTHNCEGWIFDVGVNWQPVTETTPLSSDITSRYANFRPCTEERPYQAWPTLSKPRSKVQAQVNCIYGIYPEMSVFCRYVLLENGETRLWQHRGYGLGAIGILGGYAAIFASGSATIGLFVFAILVNKMDKKNHGVEAYPPDQPPDQTDKEYNHEDITSTTGNHQRRHRS